MEPVDYTEMVRKRLGDLLLEQTRADANFEAQIVGLMTSFHSSYAKFNTALNQAVAAGISPDTALESFIMIIPQVQP